jgi:hypothetical protein
MIEVKFELEGVAKDEAQKAVSKTVRFYQQALDGVTCPTHGSTPFLTVRGNAVRRLTVSMDACCDALTSAANARVRALSRRDDDL